MQNTINPFVTPLPKTRAGLYGSTALTQLSWLYNVVALKVKQSEFYESNVGRLLLGDETEKVCVDCNGAGMWYDSYRDRVCGRLKICQGECGGRGTLRVKLE